MWKDTGIGIGLAPARRLTEMHQGTLGAEVRIARNRVEALQTFAGYKPSVVLLDIGMPGINGYKVEQAIPSRFADLLAVLVALTGWGQEDDRRRATEAGFDHHLLKPAEIEALQKLLSDIESARETGKDAKTLEKAP